MRRAPPPDLHRPIPAPPPLPPKPAPAYLEEYEERAAILEHEGRIPRTLAEWLAALMVMPKPSNIPAREWGLFADDCAAFIAYWNRQEPMTTTGRV